MNNIDKAIALLQENIKNVAPHGCKRDEVLALLTEEVGFEYPTRLDEDICAFQYERTYQAWNCGLLEMSHGGDTLIDHTFLSAESPVETSHRLPKENHDHGC